MPKKSDIPLSRHHIRLYQGDWERLQELFPKLSPNEIIRKLVRRTIRQVEERSAHSAKDVPEVDL